MLLNVSQAARAAGKSRKTIQRHIKDGKLSASKVEDGLRWIDTAELQRVYGSLNAPDTDDAVSTKMDKSQSDAPQMTQVLESQIKRLEEEIKRLNERIDRDNEEYRQRMDDLRNDRDEWRKQAQTLLLTQGEKRPEKQPTLWQYLGIGRKSA